MLSSITDLTAKLNDLIKPMNGHGLYVPNEVVRELANECLEHLNYLIPRNARSTRTIAKLTERLAEKEKASKEAMVTVNLDITNEVLRQLIRMQRDTFYGWSPKPELKDALYPVRDVEVCLSDAGGVPQVFVGGKKMLVVSFNRIFKTDTSVSGEDWFEISGYLDGRFDIVRYKYCFKTKELLQIVPVGGEK